MTFEDDLRAWRIAERASLGVRHPSHHTTLRADTVNDMNDTTATADETAASPNSLVAVRDAIASTFEKIADQHDIKVSELVNETISATLTYALARRAAKRGDVAKTVLYTGFLIRNTIRTSARRNRVSAERTATAGRTQYLTMNMKDHGPRSVM